jgi:hypothetical protein
VIASAGLVGIDGVSLSRITNSGMGGASNSTSELATLAPACRLDLRSAVCPTASGETLRALERLAAGEVLEVVSERSTVTF